MAFVVAAIIAFAETHTLLAYGAAFILSGLEALPIVGALVPGSGAIVALAALVPGGTLRFWPLLISTTLGAIAGDGISYWIGHHYRERTATLWPLRRYPGLIEHGKAFFAGHGGKAVVIARFTPGVRAVVPLVAGMVGMPGLRFYGTNILSAAIWAPAHIAAGVVVGASLTLLGAVAGRLAALVVALVVLIAFVIWLTPRAVQWLARLVVRMRDPVLIWARTRNTVFRREILSLLDPNRKELPGLLVLGAVLISSLWVLLAVLQDLIAGDPLVQADQAVLNLMQSLRVEWADSLAAALAELGDGAVTLLVATVALFWLAWRRAWRAGLYGLAAIGGAIVFTGAIGLALPRLQPIPTHAGRVLFPSPGAHVAVAVALYGFLTVLIGREVGLRLRIGIATGVSVLIAALAFARLYLGADWLSTIIASLAFGIAWVALLGFAYLPRKSPTLRPVGLLLSALVTLSLVGGVNISDAHRADLRRYAAQVNTRTMSLADWQRDGWKCLPPHRLDLFGTFEEPFTIEWVGHPDALQARLTEHGWTPPAAWTSWSALGWLSPQINPSALPVLPRLNNGRVERLVMVKTGRPLAANERLGLRLWRSDVVIPGTGSALVRVWIGAVVTETIKPVLSFGAVALENSNINVPVALLDADLTGARIVRRHAVEGDANWNGTLLLAGERVLGGPADADTGQP